VNKYGFVQLVNYDQSFTNPFPHYTNTNGEYWLDHSYPYNDSGWLDVTVAESMMDLLEVGVGTAEDQPGFDEFALWTDEFWINDQFEMFLAYNPVAPASITTPVEALKWKFESHGYINGFGNWVDFPVGPLEVPGSHRWSPFCSEMDWNNVLLLQ
jgi:hypothetical protein